MRYILASKAQCDDIRAALAQAEGYPRRVVVVGGPDLLPKDYSPAVPGWTDQAVPEPLDAGDGTAALAVHDELDKHLGRTHRVRGRNVVVPAASSKVDERDLPQKFRDILEPPGRDEAESQRGVMRARILEAALEAAAPAEGELAVAELATEKEPEKPTTPAPSSAAKAATTKTATTATKKKSGAKK